MPSQTVQFSVIIPVFNRRALLERALETVWAQRFREYEVIIVDDGSTDDTWAFLESLGNRVCVLRQANRGPGAARNLGIMHAKGAYLAFLDSDDAWFPWTLEVYSEAIMNSGSPAFLAGKPWFFHDDDQLAGAKKEPVAFLHFTDYLASSDKWSWWGVSSFVLHRETALSCSGFAEKNMNGEDADLALKLGVAPGFVQIQSPVTFAYREHAANLTGNLDKCLVGLWHKIETEQAGGYPGGTERAQERWRILTRHARPAMLACLQEGRSCEGWRMYRCLFPWHVTLGRFKFLAGFPLKSLQYLCAQAVD